MTTEKKIKLRTLLGALLIVVGVGLFFLFEVTRFTNERYEEQLDLKDQSVKKLFEKTLNRQTLHYEMRIDQLLSENNITRAFALRHREALLHATAERFRQLQNENPYIKIFTFRLPDGSVFLRVHKPQMYGDALNQKRRIIVDTNLQKHRHCGFEVGKLKMTYRIVTPIFYHQEYIGLVEFGMEPDSIMQFLSNVIDLNYALVIKKEMQEVLIEKKEMLSNHQYVLAEKNPFFSDIFQDISLTHRNFIHKNSKDYAINTHLELTDHHGEKAAFYITAENITEDIKTADHLKYTIIGLIIISVLLLLFLLNYSLNFYIKAMQKMLSIDELTKLPNRYALLKELKKSSTNSCMFLIDINGFKTINELYGVHNGNVILKQFSHLTAALAAQNNIRIFRISSDEFIFLQHSNNNANLGICEELVTKTYDTIRHHRFILYDLDIKIDIDVTIGAVYGETLSLEKADMALNKARKLGRPYLFYSDNIDTKQDTQKIIQVKKDIRYALENNNIVPYFQPIVNTHGEIIKYESLIRMIKLDGGHREVISPFYFLELSEKFNLYSHLSKTVITKSFQAIQNSNMAISINLSPSDIQDAAMNRFIFETLSTCKKTKNIIFEITENEHIEDFESVKKFIKKIQKQGAKIAIDDFGSGYANYSHIFELKPDYIKIDGSLIKNIVENQESQVFVQTIVNLAKGLGTKTIAEYVHSKEVFELVKSYGVDEFQGYYFGEPQSSID